METMNYPKVITDLDKVNHRSYTKPMFMRTMKDVYNLGRIAGRIEAKTAQGRKNHTEFLELLSASK